MKNIFPREISKKNYTELKNYCMSRALDENNILPELSPNEQFCFSCGPHTPCFNQCCAELRLPVTPYDALRLSLSLGIDSSTLVKNFLGMTIIEDTGLPLPILKMASMPGEPCPFVSPAGCSVYEDRPGACRAYPLGRASRLGVNGIEERFYLVKEDHCRGFEEDEIQTPATWLNSQDLEKYNYYNDLYMRLATMIRATGAPLPGRLSGMAVLSLYQQDYFKRLIINMKILNRLKFPAEKQEHILQDTSEGLEARLKFGFDWLELCLFGKAKDL